jgi:hypothetical protein
MDNDTDINPEGQNAITRRIVEVTDQDDTLFPEFIELYPFDAWRPQ